jgi:hypothetical protein
MTAVVIDRNERDVGKIIFWANQLGQGRSNATGTVTLTASATTTTVTAQRTALPALRCFYPRPRPMPLLL